MSLPAPSPLVNVTSQKPGRPERVCVEPGTVKAPPVTGTAEVTVATDAGIAERTESVVQLIGFGGFGCWFALAVPNVPADKDKQAATTRRRAALRAFLFMSMLR
jgi:hypothetical protein